MLLIPLLVLLGIAFYLFIGFGPADAIKIMLAGMWAIAILSIPAGIIYDLLR